MQDRPSKLLRICVIQNKFREIIRLRYLFRFRNHFILQSFDSFAYRLHEFNGFGWILRLR